MKKLTSVLLLVVFLFQLVGINAFASESQYNGSESTSNLDEVIAICKKYSDGNTVTGVRNQIDWLNQLYNAISQDFVGQLGLGETLLIALLNHTDINTTLLTSSYSTGDINREVAKIILIGAEGYADVASIAKATELKETDVRDILESIVAGGITEKTIANGKDSNSATNRGTYVKNQALKQEKVWQYLITEVARMTENPDSMAILCQDLGAGYVSNMMSGQEPDKYKVSLYKKYLAKTLDAVLDSDTPSIVSYDITKADTYKVAKKTRSVLSKIFSYEVGAEKDALPEELKAFWDEHLKNGVLSESEAREYLILSGEYQKGEHGIGEAAKQLVKGYKHLKRFKTVLDKTGKVFDAVDKLKKADEFLEYWATDYAEQEIMLDYLVESLSQSGADLDMMTAARELQQEYNDKLVVTFDKVYVAMIGKGVGTLKSAFPPLQIAESVISLSATVTGADKKVGALETGLAMQGICSQALDDYEKAVIAVNEGDTSEEAASRVLSTFKIAKQSMILYCKAMIELAETDAQKEAYSSDLQKLEQAEFGYSAISLPFGGGGGGSRNGNADLTQFAENQKPITSSDAKALDTNAMAAEHGKTYSFGNSTYAVYNYSDVETGSWYGAKEYCELQGGHLVTITSNEEQAFIEQLIRENGTEEVYWIGLYDNDSKDGWQWVTGELISYTNWRDGVPTHRVELVGEIYNGNMSEYGYFWDGTAHPGSKKDYNTTATHGFICEWENATTSHTLISDTVDSTVNSNKMQELLANNDDLLFAYAQLLNTVVMVSNDKKATHYQLFDENEDGLPEIVTYNTGGPYGAAFAGWSYSNGIVQMNFWSAEYYYYYSLCIGDQKEVYCNASASRPYQNIEVLIDNYNVVGGIEIGSSEDIISNTYRSSLQEKYRNNIEMWRAENSHVLQAYADVLKSGVTIWEPKNTPATHYWLYDKNSDGVPELLVFGRNSSFGIGFREYGYIDGEVKVIAKTADDSIYYYSLAIHNGVECCLNKKDYGEYGSVEKLVQNGHIIGGMRIGSSDDYLTKMPVVTTPNSEKAVLAIGDYVKFGNDRTWQVIHLGENTATLFHQGCFTGVFDASLHMEAHAISLMNYRTYGSATWEYSDVRQWLNAREASESALDVAFDYSNLAQGFSGMGMQATVKKESGSYAYAGKAGFLSAENFTDLEYWLLEPTQNTSCVPYTQIVTSVVNGVSSFKNFQAEMDKLYSEEIGQTQTIDRMFLLNGREIKEYLIDNGLSPYVSTSGSTYPAYWLRDAVYHGLANYYHYYGTNILTVANKGAGSQQADLEAFIRPACNINLSYVTGVSGAGTSEDPYTLTIDSSVINRPISLVDDTENTTTAEPVADFTAFEAVFQHTANKVDKELALQSAMASNKAYNKQGIFDYLVSLGFDKDSIVQEDYESTATHSVAITMAQREVVDENGTPKTLYALIIRGTNSTLEWVSNFDIGTSSVSKGFDKAASRVMGYFAKYVKNHAPLDGSFTDGNYLVWTCGHSRGAAVANLIAGKYLPMYLASDNVYAYTFATPNVDRDATICKNIFNFVIQGDLVPRVPFREWGFERYGLTINYTNDKLNGITLNTNRSTTMLSTLLTDRVKTQEEYAKTTKELLQVLESEAETKEVDLEFMVKGLFSTVYSVGTVSDIIVKMDVYEDLSMLLNMIGTDINTDELFFTTEDFFDALSLIGPTHSMDTYLEWMKQ